MILGIFGAENTRRLIFFYGKLALDSKKVCTFAHAFRVIPFDSNRDVAQLVAHYVRDVGVASSNLVIPTKRQSTIGCRFFCAIKLASDT